LLLINRFAPLLPFLRYHRSKSCRAAIVLVEQPPANDLRAENSRRPASGAGAGAAPKDNRMGYRHTQSGPASLALPTRLIVFVGRRASSPYNPFQEFLPEFIGFLV